MGHKFILCIIIGYGLSQTKIINNMVIMFCVYIFNFFFELELFFF